MSLPLYMLLALLPILQGQPKQPSPATELINKAYQELAIELANTQKKFLTTKDPAEQEKLLDEIGNASAKKLWPIIQKYPDERICFYQLLGCVSSGHVDATELLFSKFDKEDAAIGNVCLSLGKQHAMRMDRLCKQVMLRSKIEANRGLATMGLAYWQMMEADEAGNLGQLERSKASNEAARRTLEEAMAKFEKQELDLGKIAGKTTIGKMAKAALFEIHSLRVGLPAPALAGIDMDGKPLALKDYSGKVIMLSFWAHWCGPCMAMVPKERDLVMKVAEKPFVLIGVNGDEISDAIRTKTKEAQVNWRSFQDQAQEGDAKISASWNVMTWPTVYLIDAKGIIRYKWVGAVAEKELSDAVEALLKEVK